MASFTLSGPHFPSGTSVGAYPVTNWPGSRINQSAAPVGSATNSQTYAGGATFTGLTSGVKYAATDASGSRYVTFTVGEDSVGEEVTSPQIRDGAVATADIADGAVTAPKIADDAVGPDELADNAVVAAAIGSIPAARATRASGSPLTAPTGGSGTVLTLPTEDYDTDTIHDTTTNSERLTCKTAGIYIVSARVYLAYHATGVSRILTLVKNGSNLLGTTFGINDGFGGTYGVINAHLKLAVNDYLHLNVYHDRGADLAIYGEFSMLYQGKG